MKKLFSLLAVALLLPVSTFAQFGEETIEAQIDQADFEGGAANSPLECFDYYVFGSVSADVARPTGAVSQGTVVPFEGELHNANTYPLVDGTLYVKIFKQDDAVFAQGDGNIIVDQFVVERDVIIPASGSVPVSYEWTVPANAEAGEYYVAHFFATNDRYNLMGLSFTDDVVGDTVPFTVISEEGVESVVHLSKPDTTINGQDHHFAAFPLRFDATESVTISSVVVNPTSVEKTVPVQWTQYAWDGLQEENVRNSRVELVTLAPNESREISYDVTPQRESVVYVTASTQDGASKSVLNVRYVKEGITETRINFPGVTAFPLTADRTETLFACAHAVNELTAENNVLTLTLTDQRTGDTIHQYRYSGAISGMMGGYGETFTPERNYNHVTLTATLERDGAVAEEVSITYNCEDIPETDCLPEEQSDNNGVMMSDSLSSKTMLYMVGGFFVLVLVTVLFLVLSRKKKVSPAMFPILFGLVFLGVGGYAIDAAAKSTSWNYTYPGILAVCADGSYPNWGYRNECINSFGNMGWDLRNPNTTITYHANVYDHTTGRMLSEGETVPVGTLLRFSPDTHERVHTSWFGTGYSYDSPNAYWVSDAALPAAGCQATDRTVGYHYYLLAVNPPTNSVSTGGTATLTNVSGDVYRVDSPGSIVGRVHFSDTYANFYANVYDRFTPICHQFPGKFLQWYQSPADTTPNLTVPGQVIEFNLNAIPAVPSNNPPAAPTITPSGGNTNLVNDQQDFTSTATDPEGDNVRYGVDWDMDGIVDWYSDFTPSATGVLFGRTWSTPGTKQFQVLAQDDQWASSGWTQHSVTINTPPPASMDLTVTPASVNTGDTINISWNGTNVTNCTGYGPGWGGATGVSIAATGATTVTASSFGSQTYAVVCAEASDSEVVTVTNRAPNQPTITGPNSGITDTSYTFTVTGADPDGEQIYYQIDPDTIDGNNALINTPAAGYIASGVSRTWAGQWAVGGPYTFRARTVDASGNQSAWTTHTITIIPGPGITVTTNPGGDTNPDPNETDITIDSGAEVTVDWSTTYVTSCTQSGAGFTGSATSGNGVGLTEPAAGSVANSDSYTIQCTGEDGTTISHVITVTTNPLPDLTKPGFTFTPSTTVDPVTGNYTYVDVTYLFRNSSDGVVPAGGDIGTILEFRTGASGPYTFSETNSVPRSDIEPGDPAVAVTARVMDVPYGTNRVRADVDTANTVIELDEDNESVVDLTVTDIPPLDPGITLQPTDDIVRRGEVTDLEWEVASPYPMTCTILGVGVNETFDPSTTINPMTGSASGSVTSGSLNSKAVFEMSCAIPSTGVVFTTTAEVENTGQAQEV